MRLRAGVASDRGLVRPANEDSFFLRPGLYAVSDGMGGARAGEVASQMACFGLMGIDPVSAGPAELSGVVVSINRAITGRSAADNALMGMGTTLTAALIRDGRLILAHVGDSRAYLLRQGGLTQLTEDHSWVGEMVRRGELTPAQAAVHPHRSVITRALGTEAEVVPDVSETPVAPGDRLLLCSDGLSGMVTDEAIAGVLRSGGEPQGVAEELVRAALAGGGEDNITVVVVDVLEDAEEAETAQEGASLSDDRILVGPSDRTASVSASSHRVRRAGEAVRERLGRFTVPPLRPVGGQASGRSIDDTTATPDAGDAVPSEASAVPPTGPAPEPVGAAQGGRTPTETTGPTVSAAAEEAPTEAAAPAPDTANGQVAATPDGAPRRRRRRLWIFWTLVVVLLLAIAVAGFAWYNSTVYYVGTSDDGRVVLYHGLPASVFGYELSEVVEQSTVEYGSLSPYLQKRIDAHEQVGKEEGQQFLRSLSTEQ